MTEYFKSNNISKYGDNRMVYKSLVMLSIFFIPLGIMIFADVSSPLLVFIFYIISGLGMAGIGMGIMHDAIHGSYSKNKWLTWFMSNTINIIGPNKEMWRLQHNVLHHTFTNIEDHDEDINVPFFLRFSPNTKKNKLHRFQHWYAWIFYGLSILAWITVKDFINLARYKKMGLINDRKTLAKNLVNMILWKLVHFSIVFVLPLIFSSVSFWLVILAFLTMQFVTGLCITLVFQTAHIMPDNEFPQPDSDGKMENERLIHQLVTTSNFSQKSRFLFWAFGGLTHQIEHHLFPNISHIHYRDIAPIVQQTAKEFGLPYNVSGSFFAAIYKHFKMLKSLGKFETKTK